MMSVAAAMQEAWQGADHMLHSVMIGTPAFVSYG